VNFKQREEEEKKPRNLQAEKHAYAQKNVKQRKQQ